MKLRAFLAVGVLLAGAACQSGSTGGLSSLSADIVIFSDMPSSAFPPDVVPLEQAIELAIAQQREIAGFKLAYRPLDDSLGATANQAMGVQNINAMIADPTVLGMIGPFNSNVAFTEIPAAGAGDLALMSPSNTNVCLTVPVPYCTRDLGVLRPNGHSTYFRIAAPEIAQGTAMGRYAANTLGVKRVAAFSEWPNAGPLIIDAFATELAKAGGKVVLRRDLDQGTATFNQFLAQAKADGAEAVYAVTGDDGDHVCVASAQMRSMSFNAKFLVTDGALGKSCKGDAVDPEGILTTTSVVLPDPGTDPQAKAMIEAYRKAFPENSSIPEYGFAAYDCARILIAAIKQAIEANAGHFPTRSQVVKALAAIHFTGLTGTYAFDPNGDALSPMMSIYEIKKGAWVYQQQVGAGRS